MSTVSDGGPALAGVEQMFPDLLKRRYACFNLPISGLRVRIQSLSERETSQYQAATIADKSGNYRRQKFEDAKRRLIVLCLVDDAGNRMLNDSHSELIADKWDGADTEFLYRKIAAHCGLNTTDIEDLVKNSEGITVADSPSN